MSWLEPNGCSTTVILTTIIFKKNAIKLHSFVHFNHAFKTKSLVFNYLKYIHTSDFTCFNIISVYVIIISKQMGLNFLIVEYKRTIGFLSHTILTFWYGNYKFVFYLFNAFDLRCIFINYFQIASLCNNTSRADGVLFCLIKINTNTCKFGNHMKMRLPLMLQTDVKSSRNTDSFAT